MAVDYGKVTPNFIYDFLGYLKIECGLAPNTIYGYFIELRLFFRYTYTRHENLLLDEMDKLDFVTIPMSIVEEIDRKDISSYLNWMAMEKEYGERTRNRALAVLKSFFKYLLRVEILEKNVMDNFSSSKTRKTLPKYLDSTEVLHLVESVNGEFWVRDVAIIMLMMSSGLRVSEVHSLNFEDFRQNYVRVLGKGNKERQVYLSKKTIESLEEYLQIRKTSEENAFFLSRLNKRMAVRSIQHMTKKYLTMIGKSDYSCHKLRHTAATQMLKQGANLREIQETLGHENINTTEIYTHVTNSQLEKWLVN